MTAFFIFYENGGWVDIPGGIKIPLILCEKDLILEDINIFKLDNDFLGISYFFIVYLMRAGLTFYHNHHQLK